jgi:hypothetical protein
MALSDSKTYPERALAKPIISPLLIAPPIATKIILDTLLYIGEQTDEGDLVWLQPDIDVHAA